jgi:hypothetical protein
MAGFAQEALFAQKPERLHKNPSSYPPLPGFCVLA